MTSACYVNRGAVARVTRLRTAALILLSGLLGGCLASGNQPRVTADYAATVDKVGIMSLIDTHPNVSNLLQSAQESRFGKLALPDWDAHELAQSVLGSRLRRKGFEVSSVEPDAAIRAAHGKDWGTAENPALREALHARGSALGLDVLVVVSRHTTPDTVTGTNQKIRGYGLQRAFDTGPHAYAVVYVQAIDIEGGVVAGAAEGLQMRTVPDQLWQTRFNDARGELTVAPDAADALREILATLLTNAIGSAAQEAGL